MNLGRRAEIHFDAGSVDRLVTVRHLTDAAKYAPHVFCQWPVMMPVTRRLDCRSVHEVRRRLCPGWPSRAVLCGLGQLGRIEVELR